MRLAALGFVGVVFLGSARQGDGVVRLKPGDFRQLPAAVRRDLDRRRCLIPQAPSKPAPHNVIAGSFIATGSRDWAVLCSVKGESRVLVYRAGRAAKVDSLGVKKDSLFLQLGESGVPEFSRKLDVTTAKSIADRAKGREGPKLPALDHDGIDDGFAGKASTTRYYSRGRWIALPGAD